MFSLNIEISLIEPLETIMNKNNRKKSIWLKPKILQMKFNSKIDSIAKWKKKLRKIEKNRWKEKNLNKKSNKKGNNI